MKYVSIKSAITLIYTLSIITPIAVTAEPTPTTASERQRLEQSVTTLFNKFEESINFFKKPIACLSPKSTVKIHVVAQQIREAIEKAVALFIDPMHAELQQLKGSGLEHSNYAKLLATLLALCMELKKDFDLLYHTLHTQLQEKKSAVVITTHIKPIIDALTSDEKFKRIDAKLAEACTYAQAYDITIEIKPEHRKIIDIKDENPGHTYEFTLTQAFSLMRTALELLRKECRKPAALKEGEILRIIRSRL
jgi:hypothetical protein